jgi:hypothetical protein
MATKRKVSSSKTTKMQTWGAVASFVLAFASIASSLIYFTGNLRDALGALSYSFADFMYGPLWGASLVLVILALQDRFGAKAPRRMNLALLTGVLTAAAFVTVACIRAANRGYHLSHPELGLEFSAQSVMIGWTTLVAGLIGAGRHVMGWCLILLGSAGWNDQRSISVLYVATGLLALFVYAFPSLDEVIILLGFVLSIWQGVLLLRPSAKQR